MKHTLIPLVLAVAMGSGCLHTNTKLPGVLDLRSDGSDAAAQTEAIKPNEETTREGFGSIINGGGLQVAGDKLTVEDRQWYLVGLVHIVNDQAEAEYKAGVPSGGALKNVMIGDTLAGTDILIMLAPVLVSWIPIVNLVTLINLAPHMTINMSGQRIQSSGGGAAVEPPPPTDGAAPPADPNAPATTAPGT